MSNIEYYIDLIRKLTERVAQLEEENNALKLQLSTCEGKIDVLNRFYIDFNQRLNKGDLITHQEYTESPNESDNQFGNIKKQVKTYNDSLEEYFVTNDPNVADSLFGDYNVPPSQVLTDIRESLPSNINELVEKYNCENEYRIILKSLEFMEKYKFNNKTLSQLIDKYITNYVSQNKKLAYNYVVQVLKFFPFQLNKFLENISQYRYDDLDDFIEEQKHQLYRVRGKRGRKPSGNKPVKKVGGKRGRKPKNVTPVTEAPVTNSEKSEQNSSRIDYSILTVKELIDMVLDTEINKRQKSKRIIKGMERAGRTEMELNEFKNAVNKFFREEL